MRNYAVFIMTHGRADSVLTDKSLRKAGYTGKIYYVIDTEDEQAEAYKKNFGYENVLVFDKKEVESKMDTGDIEGSMKCVVFARNKCFDFAKELGLEYFIEADDDYTAFSYRAEIEGQLKQIAIKNALDDVFEETFAFLDNSGALSVAPAQCGDYIGGLNGKVWKSRLQRKCMNLFFCKTARPINFIGRINEDVNTYSYYGQRGEIFFTIADWCLNQKPTQSQQGGMTDTYLDSGTYLKSFYSVMWNPSCVKVAAMGSPGHGGNGHFRIHHNVNWQHCTPMILNEKWKKRGGD